MKIFSPFLPFGLPGSRAGSLSLSLSLSHTHTHTHTLEWSKYCECSTNHHIKAHNYPISRFLQLQYLRWFIWRAFQMLQATKVSGRFYFLPLNSVEKSLSSSPSSLRWKSVISLAVLRWWTGSAVPLARNLNPPAGLLVVKTLPQRPAFAVAQKNSDQCWHNSLDPLMARFFPHFLRSIFLFSFS